MSVWNYLQLVKSTENNEVSYFIVQHTVLFRISFWVLVLILKAWFSLDLPHVYLVSSFQKCCIDIENYCEKLSNAETEMEMSWFFFFLPPFLSSELQFVLKDNDKPTISVDLLYSCLSFFCVLYKKKIRTNNKVGQMFSTIICEPCSWIL